MKKAKIGTAATRQGANPRQLTELKGHMSTLKWLILATLGGVMVAGFACTQKAADQSTNGTAVTVDKPNTGTDKALDAAKEGADKALDATRRGAGAVIDETKAAGEKTADGTKNIAQKTGDKTKEIAGKTADKTKEIAVAVGSKTKEVVSTTGEAITDGWITTKVKAKFVDETLLKGSDINVDTNDHVVTLKGRVTSAAGKTRAAAIARGTEGVTRVVNQLVVRAR
jgi:hyperosmotically inducible protein